MANIKLNLPAEPFTGQTVTFPAPCGCDEVTDGLSINGDIYTVVDAMGVCVTGKGGAWCSGALVSVILDVETKKAYAVNTASMSGRWVTIKEFQDILSVRKCSFDVSDVHWDAYDEFILEWDAMGNQDDIISPSIGLDGQDGYYGVGGEKTQVTAWNAHPQDHSVTRYRFRFMAQSKLLSPGYYFFLPIELVWAYNNSVGTGYHRITEGMNHAYGDKFTLQTIDFDAAGFSDREASFSVFNVRLRGLAR